MKHTDNNVKEHCSICGSLLSNFEVDMCKVCRMENEWQYDWNKIEDELYIKDLIKLEET